MIHTKHEIEFGVKIREHEFDCAERVIKKSLVFSVFLCDSEVTDHVIRNEFAHMIEEYPAEFDLEFDADTCTCTCNSRGCSNVFMHPKPIDLEDEYGTRNYR